MALKNKNGNYIRADLGRCYADISGFHTAYLVSSSEEERRLEKIREQKVKELSQNVDNLYASYLIEINREAAERNLNLPEDSHKLSEDSKLKLSVVNSIFRDLEIVRRNIYKTSEREMPSNLELLIELGLDKDWFENSIPYPQSIREVSSPYNRQRFDFSTVYKELKKVIKDGFEDC